MSCDFQPAKALGSKLSAVTVTEPYESVVGTEAKSLLRPADYNKQPEESAAKILAKVSSAAEAADSACDVIHEQNQWHCEGVVEAAKKMCADLVALRVLTDVEALRSYLWTVRRPSCCHIRRSLLWLFVEMFTELICGMSCDVAAASWQVPS